ncbi:MAG: hypothetical protein KAK00_01695 [Nanoarchaeota archaeon]|nr:hypothetical protein [Nanoarchaeota archaeon]
MTKEYTEDELIEKTAIELMQEELDYDYEYCFNEWDSGQSLFGRETKSDVVLVERLSKAIDKLNNNLPKEAKKQAIQELTKDRSRLSPVKANQEV